MRNVRITYKKRAILKIVKMSEQSAATKPIEASPAASTVCIDCGEDLKNRFALLRHHHKKECPYSRMRTWVCRACDKDLGTSYDVYHAHVKTCSSRDDVDNSFPPALPTPSDVKPAILWSQVPLHKFYRVDEIRRVASTLFTLHLQADDGKRTVVEISDYFAGNLERFASTLSSFIEGKLYIANQGPTRSLLRPDLTYDGYSVLFY